MLEGINGHVLAVVLIGLVFALGAAFKILENKQQHRRQDRLSDSFRRAHATRLRGGFPLEMG